MRIISGTHKSRTIHAPKNLRVRPTTDYAKESLFNILNNNFDYTTLKVLDLFSGTGNITYEFASRGCIDITAVDSNYNSSAFVKKTIIEFGFKGVKTIKSDVFHFLKNCTEQFDLVFADPPYEMEGIEKIPGIVHEQKLLKESGWLIVEHSARISFSEKDHLIQKRNYGNVNFSIFG